MSLEEPVAGMTMDNFRQLIIACSLVCSAILGVGAIQAENLHLSGIPGSFNVPVKSLQEMRWERVIRQRYDYSCGSAALATLLTYHYEMPTREEDVFRVMFAQGDQAKIRAEGFSLYDMKSYLDRLGLRSDGFRMSLDKLAEIGVPAVALVNTQGYRHFIVIKAIEDDRVLVGDPAVGAAIVPRPMFESIWNGIVLAARGQVLLAQQHFNSEEDLKIMPAAPLELGLDRTGLGIMTLSLPGPNELGR